MRALAENGDLRGILTALYGPPWYLSQRTLAQLTGRGQTTIGRELRGLTCLTSLPLIRESLASLGAPRTPWSTTAPLPEEPTTDRPPPGPPSSGTVPLPGEGVAPALGEDVPAVVIRVPVPVHTSAPGSLVVVVAAGAAWTVDAGPGHTTICVALPSK
ncbi:hypothetical protein ACFVWN_04495 [Nocardiopsis flavescens]|uniref:hypothetical protein n=1 Tax=Nocardiopsis flavescens TaxID=758803 RepID=UPI00365652E2